MARLLTIMGSGETAPTMVKPHREVFARLGVDSPIGVLLDTPYGFQANADIISDKAVDYFRQSVGRMIEVARLRRTDHGDTVAIEQALARIRGADWLFTGPGSPSFALRQWAGTTVPDLLAEKLRSAGALVFSSAAALTLGVVTVPVYEIYKVGSDPYWLDGLDLLTTAGLPVAVIPHFDNNEGGNHDTRFCYLGEPRLERLERELPDGAFVLGVDEHTGLIMDLDADTATIVGRGGITLRKDGRQAVLGPGQTVSLDVLRAGGLPPAGAGETRTSPTAATTAIANAPPDAPATTPASLAESTKASESAFGLALAAGDADSAVAAALALDDAITAWSADTLQSDEMDRARAALRAMIVRLGQAATEGLRDPRLAVSPVVRAALALRAAVRSERRYDLSDLLRDELAAAGVEVRDTPMGVEWDLRSGS